MPVSRAHGESEVRVIHAVGRFMFRSHHCLFITDLTDSFGDFPTQWSSPWRHRELGFWTVIRQNRGPTSAPFICWWVRRLARFGSRVCVRTLVWSAVSKWALTGSGSGSEQICVEHIRVCAWVFLWVELFTKDRESPLDSGPRRKCVWSECVQMDLDLNFTVSIRYHYQDEWFWHVNSSLASSLQRIDTFLFALKPSNWDVDSVPLL